MSHLLRPDRVPVLGLLLLISSCAQPTTEDQLPSREELLAGISEYDVVIALLDAAAASHFGFMGYERDTTPSIDALAAESIVFERAYAQASATPLSVVSMLTARYPTSADAPSLRGEVVFEVPEEAQLLPELLGELFPARFGASANQWISRRFGFDQGFTEFREVWDEAQVPDPTAPRARRVVDVARRWFDAHGDQRRFSYLHFLEPHEPYSPPEPWFDQFDPEAGRRLDGSRRSLAALKTRRPGPKISRNVVALYDGNLPYVDAELGSLIDSLKDEGRWDRTVFVLVADHGEAFWQHGAWGHGRHVYEEYVRVPFLLRIPGFPGLAGTRIEDPVELVDLVPTILDLFDRSADWIDPEGNSLLGYLASDMAPPPPSPAFFRNSTPQWLELGASDGRFKWILNPGAQTEQLYDLRQDPEEQTDLVETRSVPDEARGLLDALVEWLQRPPSDAAPTLIGVDSLDADLQEQLKSLGYFH